MPARKTIPIDIDAFHETVPAANCEVRQRRPAGLAAPEAG
jgi:hypothetical protein